MNKKPTTIVGFFYEFIKKIFLSIPDKTLLLMEKVE